MSITFKVKEAPHVSNECATSVVEELILSQQNLYYFKIIETAANN